MTRRFRSGWSRWTPCSIRAGRKWRRKFWRGCARTPRCAGIDLPFSANTPYANTIPLRLEPLFPGDQELERRIKSLIRWNALAMVVRANRVEHNIGGHISTYASAATLYEVGFNHFFRARSEEFEGDTIYFQGHAAPACMRARFSKDEFRRSSWKIFGGS